MPGSYFLYSLDFFGSAGGDRIGFGGYTTDGYFDLDDVSVVENGQFLTPPSADVPEPASLTLVGIALGVAGLFGRGRSTKPAV